VEERAHRHFLELNGGGIADSSVLNDPYFSSSRAKAQMPCTPLECLDGRRDEFMIRDSMCPIPPLRSKVQHYKIYDSEDDCSNDGETYTGIARGKRKRVPDLTSEALRAWVLANLEAKKGGQLSYTELKKMIGDAFQQGKPSDALMKAAGIDSVGGDRWVRDIQTRARLVLKSTASSSSGGR
jgi:hypothetical protein